MLPKTQRLTKRLIEEQMKHARRIQTAHFLVIYSPIEGQIPTKISLVVSKKVAKLAVVRNRLRRRGYSSIVPFLQKIQPGFLVLVQYKQLWMPENISDITEELSEAFKKATITS